MARKNVTKNVSQSRKDRGGKGPLYNWKHPGKKTKLPNPHILPHTDVVESYASYTQKTGGKMAKKVSQTAKKK